jgi:lycopene elongase/hydratase (flavuxanthin-forming)
MSAEALRTAPAPAGALRQLIGSSRPLSWVNTAYPFAAAYLLAGGGVDAVLVVGTVYFLVPYNLLMYGVNDVFDYESDLQNPRKGGVEGVVLLDKWHRLTLWSAALANLPFVVYLVVAGTAWSSAALAVVLFAVVAYSAPGLRFKERPLVDSVTSSTHFVGPAVVGLAMSGRHPTGVAVVALVAFFAWGVASQAFGAVQDITADRSAGIGSVATWCGARRTVRLALAAYATGGALLLVGAGWPGRLAGLLVVPYLLNIWRYRRLDDADCGRAHAGWRRFLVLNYVTGFLLTQLLIWCALRGR